MRHFHPLLLVVLLASIGCDQRPAPIPSPPAPDPRPKIAEFGKFEGTFSFEWLAGGRDMKSLSDIRYIDPRGKAWLAPAGSVVNGASIPRPLWSIVGGPYEGAYREASVVHDVACEEMNERWQDVHWMFYEACRCKDVSESMAKVMYWAVYHGGPRWEQRMVAMTENGRTVKRWRTQRSKSPRLTNRQLGRAREFIEANNPTLEQIEALQFN